MVRPRKPKGRKLKRLIKELMNNGNNVIPMHGQPPASQVPTPENPKTLSSKEEETQVKAFLAKMIQTFIWDGSIVAPRLEDIVNRFNKLAEEIFKEELSK